jgi:tRNA-Thr(GGU) m(6)t(6)A37 methyltransferase TsaA
VDTAATAATQRTQRKEQPVDYTVMPIGHVRGTRSEPFDDHWDTETTSIELDTARFTADALLGLDAFSHVEVIYLFDRVPTDEVVYGARRPRGNPEWPLVGIFAQRGKNRPNLIGASVCRVRALEGTTLHVEGLDAVDGTPVLDLKPYMIEFGPRGDLQQPQWSTELMRDYW